jgi:hypothetical protein
VRRIFGCGSCGISKCWPISLFFRSYPKDGNQHNDSKGFQNLPCFCVPACRLMCLWRLKVNYGPPTMSIVGSELPYLSTCFNSRIMKSTQACLQMPNTLNKRATFQPPPQRPDQRYLTLCYLPSCGLPCDAAVSQQT